MSTAATRSPMDRSRNAVLHGSRGVCGARTRQGTICKNAAGKGVAGSGGVGPCKFHGGAGALASLKHGRYSTLRRPRILELLERFASDPEPFSVLDDLHLMRALTHDFVERAGSGGQSRQAELRTLNQALDELAAVLGDEVSPAQEQQLARGREALVTLGADASLPDVAEGVKLLAEVSKAIHRVEQLRSAGAVPLDQLRRFLAAIDRVLQHRVEDEELRRTIRRDFYDIRI